MQQCKHGEMKLRNGQSEKGPWSGYFCTQPKGAPDQCQPVWLGKDGQPRQAKPKQAGNEEMMKLLGSINDNVAMILALIRIKNATPTVAPEYAPRSQQAQTTFTESTGVNTVNGVPVDFRVEDIKF